MPKSRRNDPPKEDYQQLDIVKINEKISKVSDDIKSSIEAQDKRFNRLEKRLDTRFAVMTKKLTDAISGKQQEARREGHDQKRRKKSENVDEESDKEEGDSKGEVVPTDSEKEPAEEHISTGKDKKEAKEMEEEGEDKEEIKGKENNWEKDEGKKVNVTKEEAPAKPKKEEKKEAKASPSNADKEKKPAADKKGKEKVSEEVKVPTIDELYAATSKLIEEADFNTVSPADIRRQLGAHFNVDFMDRKEEVNQIIEDVINWP